MRRTQTFVKTLKSDIKNETARSAGFLLRAGYISKELAGVYDFLPLGLRVRNKIEQIVRDEMNSLSAEEMELSALQNPILWQKTDRWDDKNVDIWFKTKLHAGGELGLGPTHEEPITNLIKTYITSYKDLPRSVYQFQTKFRNELRAKSGIMRTREFLMKDLYSFHASEEDLDRFYDRVAESYKNIYAKVGLGDCTFQTFASGGVFSKYSHEFQTFLPVGEDTVYYNPDKSIVLNDEVYTNEVLKDLGVKKSELESTSAAEVGNIFKLGSKYSAALGLTFTDENNETHPVIMGCYGIGISRLLGVIAEKFSDEKGLIWPESVAPYQYYLIAIGDNAAKVAEELYAGHEDQIFFDDRDARPGEKFADADLMGIPTRIVISDKTLKNNSAELTNRTTGKTELIPLENLKIS